MDDKIDDERAPVRAAGHQPLWDLVDLIASSDESAALRRLGHFRELADMARRAAQRDLALARLELALRSKGKASA
jgi:hypothetical protein